MAVTTRLCNVFIRFVTNFSIWCQYVLNHCLECMERIPVSLLRRISAQFDFLIRNWVLCIYQFGAWKMIHTTRILTPVIHKSPVCSCRKKEIAQKSRFGRWFRFVTDRKENRGNTRDKFFSVIWALLFCAHNWNNVELFLWEMTVRWGGSQTERTELARLCVG